MKKFFIGKKVGMTQLIDPEGKVAAVTVIQAPPCVVIEKQAVDGETATVVVGTGSVKEKHLNKATKGFYQKQGVAPAARVKGFRTTIAAEFEVAKEIPLTIFEVDELVNVRAKTIGRGFTGTIKRHNFNRGPMAHGSKSHRIPGSIGAGTTPGRVVPGKRMAGHYGDSFVTIKNLKIVKVDPEKGLLFIGGAVPGKAGYVEIFN